MPSTLELDDEELRHDLEDLPAADLVRDPLFQTGVCLPFKRQTKGFVEAVDVVRATSERLYRVRYHDGHLQHFTAAEIKVMLEAMDLMANLAGTATNQSNVQWPKALLKRPAIKDALGCMVGHAPPKSRSGRRRPKEQVWPHELDRPKSRSGKRRPKDNAQVTHKHPHSYGLSATTLNTKSAAAKQAKTVSAKSKAAAKQGAKMAVLKVPMKSRSGRSGRSNWLKWRVSGAEKAAMQQRQAEEAKASKTANRPASGRHLAILRRPAANLRRPAANLRRPAANLRRPAASR